MTPFDPQRPQLDRQPLAGHGRRVLRIVGTLLVAASLTAGVFASIGADRDGAAPTAPAAIDSAVASPSMPDKPRNGFRHGSHLPEDWKNTAPKQQHAQLCQTCHVHDATATLGFRPITSTSCAGCHFNDPTKGGNTELLKFDAPKLQRKGFAGQPFNHATKGHLDQACSECHRSGTGAANGARYQDVLFDVTRTLAQCASCHDHGVSDPAKQHMMATGAAQKCETCHRAGQPVLLRDTQRTAQRAFRHSSHMPASALQQKASNATCLECHDATPEIRRVDPQGALLDANVIAARIETDACSQCHHDAAKATTVVALPDRELQRVPSRFLHQRHQKVVDNFGCVHCHKTPDGAADPTVDWHYGQCTECHEGVPKHGTSQRCTSCHGAPLTNKDVVRVDVHRAQLTAASFTLDGAQHPAITARGGDVHAAAGDRACSDCHRNKTDALRAQPAQAFLHAHHVGADRSDAACATCHVSVTGSRSSVDLEAFAAATLRESSVCTATCHAGTRVAFATERAAVSVPAFSHAHHLTAGLHCTECHGTDAEPRDLRTADLQMCAACHGHKESEPEKFARTGPGGTAANGNPGVGAPSKCTLCHVVDASKSLVTTPVSARLQQLALGTAHQFHDKRGDCSKCHGYDSAPTDRVYAELRITARDSIHQSPFAIAAEHLPSKGGGPDCRHCHRRLETLTKAGWK